MEKNINTSLNEKINLLPDYLKSEVEDFIDFISDKHKFKKEKPKEDVRKFGYAKGTFKMSDDFDETPEDFKDYM